MGLGLERGGAGRRETRAARAAGVAAGAGILVLLLLIVLLWTGVGAGVFRHAPQTAATARRRTPSGPAATTSTTAAGSPEGSPLVPAAPAPRQGPGATLGPGDGGGGGDAAGGLLGIGGDNDSEVVVISEMLEQDKKPLEVGLPPTADEDLDDETPLADSAPETPPEDPVLFYRRCSG
ncbi:hypothetical protein ONE63_009799 [Megalurothrips usitatus]|uniref:Uncharacterized protein n=1 Tax=Megalurothrips usitatus TaxID=439358 RepID=A0AAV7XMC1_9NEOP|nr:hypothetical protein ONE63_009799 [Megalurothrips usitatus]